MLTALLIVLGAGWRAIIITLLVAVGFARGGARLLHGLLPPTLIESGAKPPTDAEMAAAAGAGLFCVDGIKTFGDSLAAEYALAHFSDAAGGGEWYGYCDRDGRVTHPFKGGPYKGCFHVPRALLKCEAILERLAAPSV